MNWDDMTLGDMLKAASASTQTAKPPGVDDQTTYNNGMIGRYVIVRCRDAGVHAGFLVSHSGRECILERSRRLWYWKPANGGKFLCGVARHGLDSSSKIGGEVERLHLTETCEIIATTKAAEASIIGSKVDGN